MTAAVNERFIASILAGAMGDALGAPVEFLSIEQIRSQFGPNGIQEFATAYGVHGSITDDTQMTLFTLEGLCDPDRETGVWHAYLRWMQTQGETTLALPKGNGRFDLVNHRQLHHRRAPGMTCLNALRSSDGSPAKNDSKGCGTVMGTAPYAILGSVEEAWNLSVTGAALTHGHIEGQVSAAIMAATLWQVIRGAELRSATQLALEMAQERGYEKTLSVSLTQKALSTEKGTPLEAFAADGRSGGWVAEEAWAMGLFAALCYPDNLKAALRFAVNHTGDSDSTGAIAGNLLGAAMGMECIPEDWLAQLELAEVIRRCAEQTADLLLS